MTHRALPLPHSCPISKDGDYALPCRSKSLGTIQHLRTVEVEASYGIGERTFEPQAFYVHYLLGVGQS